MSTQPWYEELFDEQYLRVWAPMLPPERAEAELAGLDTLLQLPPGAKILDLCCGHGRHAVPLAGRGYAVTGQDLSEVFLDRARAAAREAGVEVRWVRSDMRTIPFEAEFDAVVNLFTAFGYLETDDEDLTVLRQVRRALKPGGRFVLDVIHRDALMRRWRPSNVTRHPDGLISIEEGRFDFLTGRNHTVLTLIEPDGRRWERRYSVRIYALSELARMLREAGMEVEAAYGGLDRSPLALDSSRLVVVARKPEESR